MRRSRCFTMNGVAIHSGCLSLGFLFWWPMRVVCAQSVLLSYSHHTMTRTAWRNWRWHLTGLQHTWRRVELKNGGRNGWSVPRRMSQWSSHVNQVRVWTQSVTTRMMYSLCTMIIESWILQCVNSEGVCSNVQMDDRSATSPELTSSHHTKLHSKKKSRMWKSLELGLSVLDGLVRKEKGS